MSLSLQARKNWFISSKMRLKRQLCFRRPLGRLICHKRSSQERLLSGSYLLKFQKLTIRIDRNFETGWKLTAEMLESALKTNPVPPKSLLVFTNPDNPTGCVYSEAELKSLAYVSHLSYIFLTQFPARFAVKKTLSSFRMKFTRDASRMEARIFLSPSSTQKERSSALESPNGAVEEGGESATSCFRKNSDHCTML